MLSSVKLPRLEHPLYPTALIAVIAAVLLWTLRPGLEWDGDPELYIMNARNIVSGLPYAHSGYLFNPANVIHPAAYPPGFPLFLAPVYAFFGIDLFKMKLEGLATLVAFLAIYFLIARRYLTPGFALATTAAIGLHPALLNMAECSLLSEFPFLCFAYTALYLMHRLQTVPLGRRDTAATVAMAALALAAAFLTRSIGVLLFPTALAASLYGSRRLITSTTLTLAVAGILILVTQRAFPGDIGTYVHYFADFSLHTVWVGARRYAGVSVSLLGTLAVKQPVLGILLGATFLGFFFVGFWDRVRRLAIFEIFVVVYIGFLLVFPVTLEVLRYSMPIWPLLFLYCANGVAICARAPRARSRALVTAVGVVIMALYGAQYVGMSGGPVPFSVDAAQSGELFAAIRGLPPQARLLTRKPTIIALYTGHSATIWPESFTDQELWSFMRRLGVDYVVQDIPQIAGAKPDDAFDAFVGRNRSALTLVFKNEWFNLYQATSEPALVAPAS